MPALYVLHIVAGSLGILTGFAALAVTKGAPAHRRAGMAFVAAMLTMTACGFVIAIARDVAPAVNVPAAILTAYLVLTALTTVRPVAALGRAFDRGALLVVLAVSLVDLGFGAQAVAAGGARDGMPAFPFLMFGVVGLLAAAGDIRIQRTGAPRGAPRLARHLWRMCFALFIAALSFFIGQAKVIPKPIRIPALLALPVLAVLVSMLYWLWRVRVRRSLGGIVRHREAAEAA